MQGRKEGAELPRHEHLKDRLSTNHEVTWEARDNNGLSPCSTAKLAQSKYGGHKPDLFEKLSKL